MIKIRRVIKDTCKFPNGELFSKQEQQHMQKIGGIMKNSTADFLCHLFTKNLHNVLAHSIYSKYINMKRI